MIDTTGAILVKYRPKTALRAEGSVSAPAASVALGDRDQVVAVGDQIKKAQRTHLFQAHDKAGGATIAAAATVMPLDTVDENTGPFSLAASQVTVTAKGVAVIDARSSIGSTGKRAYKAQLRVLLNGEAVPAGFDLASGASRESRNVINVYGTVGGQVVAATAVKVAIDATRANSNPAVFSLSSSTITVTRPAGARFVRIIHGSLLGTTGSGDFAFELFLKQNSSEVTDSRIPAGKGT